MTFYQQPAGYVKTVLSDLQGAWGNLRRAVVDESERVDCGKLLFHIDEAMSWESVRNLEQMQKTFVLVQSLAQQLELNEEAMMWVEEVRDSLYATLRKIEEGEHL